MPLSIESGKVIGQILTVLKYVAKLRNDTRRFRPSPKNIKVLLMKTYGAAPKQFITFFKNPVKALPVPVMAKEPVIMKKEDVELPIVDIPEIYGERVLAENLFDSWIYFAQDKSNLPNRSTEEKPKVTEGIARPYFPPANLSRLEQIKKRIRDNAKKNNTNPTKFEL